MTPSPDSPRWCEECQEWGDHHTDRHEATPRVMRPEEAQAYRHYLANRPTDPDERSWLRRRFGGQR